MMMIAVPSERETCEFGYRLKVQMQKCEVTYITCMFTRLY